VVVGLLLVRVALLQAAEIHLLLLVAVAVVLLVVLMVLLVLPGLYS
jgi:hypothetical protein